VTLAIITSPQRIRREVREAFARIDSDAIALHTDLPSVGFFRLGVPRQQQLADLFQMLVEGSAGRTLLFPTFNYDFCRTGVYDPVADPCQVGVLNEYVRTLHPRERTLTPVFSFCIHNNRDFSLEPAENPLSATSTFGELVARRATVAFFGALVGNTFLHHIEDVMEVGYRYIKPFPGVIRRDGADRQIVLRYRVRPLIEGLDDYDVDRLAHDLLDNQLLHQAPLGNGKLFWFRADRMVEYSCMRVKEDELYLLAAASRRKVQELYAQYGKPLRYEAVELSRSVASCAVRKGVQ
jgi:aminoglycoside 3-N-acetyltransferase